MHLNQNDPNDTFTAMTAMTAMTATIPNVVVVDSQFESYKSLAASARLGRINLHFRASGAAAFKHLKHQRVDVWLVASQLDDMSGDDFVELLQATINRSGESSGSHKINLASPSVAMVVESTEKNREQTASLRESLEYRDGSTIVKPITFRDLEGLLGMPTSQREAILADSLIQRMFVTLPISVGAAVVAIVILSLG